MGWRDNSRTWADLDVEYGRSTEGADGGKACQQIVCSRLDSGAVQMISSRPTPLTRGRVYRVRAWLKGDGQPRPNVAAYAQMSWILDGAVFDRVDRPTDDVWLYQFTTPRGHLAVAWARTNRQAPIEFPGASQAWDLMGSRLDVPRDKTLMVSDAAIYVLSTRQ